MNQKEKQAIIRQIIHIASNATDSPPLEDNLRRHTIIMANIDGQAISFHLVDDIADEYEELYKRLLREQDWGEKFSEDHVDKALRMLIARLRRDGDISFAPQYFDQLTAEFDSYSQEQVVYLPLVGISLHVDALPFGNITLVKMTDERLNNLISEADAIMRQTAYPPEQIAAFKQAQQQEMQRYLTGRICAEFRVVAEADRARERAEEETRRVLDLLRYSIPALYRSNLRVAVGLERELGGGYRGTPIISTDGNNFRWQIHGVSPLRPFMFSPESMSAMERLGVFEVAKILQKPSKRLTDFEDLLLQGIHWFANAQTQVERGNELLSLITCLETFLTPRDNNPIGTAIAEGAALILDTRLEVRKALKKRIKDLYGKRSAVSHGGRESILEADLSELRTIAGSLTMRLIERRDEFKSQKDLLNWIEDQKLG